MSGLLDAGPSVARIFTLRDRGPSVSLKLIALLKSRFAHSRNCLRFNPLEQLRRLA
jgi:hypothetical protein